MVIPLNFFGIGIVAKFFDEYICGYKDRIEKLFPILKWRLNIRFYGKLHRLWISHQPDDSLIDFLFGGQLFPIKPAMFDTK